SRRRAPPTRSARERGSSSPSRSSRRRTRTVIDESPLDGDGTLLTWAPTDRWLAQWVLVVASLCIVGACWLAVRYGPFALVLPPSTRGLRLLPVRFDSRVDAEHIHVRLRRLVAAARPRGYRG